MGRTTPYKRFKNYMLEEKKDLKEGVDVTEAGEGQPDENIEKDNDNAEGIEKENEAELLQKQLDEEKALRLKIEEERDNYKQGMLSAKAKKISLDDDEDESENIKHEVKSVADNSDEEGWAEVERRAEQKAKSIFESENKKQAKLNEKVAIKEWLKENPELLNDSMREAVIENYTARHGKSVEGIKYDLGVAYKLYKIDNGLPLDNKSISNSAEKELAATPAPSGVASGTSSTFNQFELQIMKENGYTPEVFKQWKEKVLSGQMYVPDEVLNKLKS